MNKPPPCGSLLPEKQDPGQGVAGLLFTTGYLAVVKVFEIDDKTGKNKLVGFTPNWVDYTVWGKKGTTTSKSSLASMSL